MATFITSDTHFFHKNIMKFCPDSRQGDDYLEMTRILIMNIQRAVKPSDTIYFLGDFSFADREATKSVLDQLPGHKILVTGNHDKGILNTDLRNRFDLVSPYLEHRIEGTDAILFHYPIAEWSKCQYGSVHCFGHVHGKEMGLKGKCLDVGIDNRPDGDMMPWSWAEVMRYMNKQPIIGHH